MSKIVQVNDIQFDEIHDLGDKISCVKDTYPLSLVGHENTDEIAIPFRFATVVLTWITTTTITATGSVRLRIQFSDEFIVNHSGGAVIGMPLESSINIGSGATNVDLLNTQIKDAGDAMQILPSASQNYIDTDRQHVFCGLDRVRVRIEGPVTAGAAAFRLDIIEVKDY